MWSIRCNHLPYISRGSNQGAWPLKQRYRAAYGQYATETWMPNRIDKGMHLRAILRRLLPDVHTSLLLEHRVRRLTHQLST